MSQRHQLLLQSAAFSASFGLSSAPLAFVHCLVKGQTENTFGKDRNLCADGSGGQQIKVCRTEISVSVPKRSQPRHRVCGELSRAGREK